MDIVIISEFCGDFSPSDNDRFFYIAKKLADMSNENCIEIVTSSFQHTTKRQREELEESFPFRITFVDEPGYPRNICPKRFLSHYTWGKNIARYLSNREKPDVVYCAVPSLTGPYLVAKYCEKEKIRFVIDVQDLWPEAFQMIVNIPVLSRIGFAPFKALANGIYKRADAICAVSDTYCKRAAKVNSKVKDTTTVYLGTELATFDRYASGISDLEKKDGEIWIAYCGTLGSSYDLTCVFDALEILDDERIRFIVMGDGPKMQDFTTYCEGKRLKVTFTGRLSYDRMCGMLSACDITVNPIVHLAAQSIINKHADYAASALPVVNTQESEEYRELVDRYRMGFNCRNNDPIDMSEKIDILARNEELRLEMGRNARRCAEERFDRKMTYRLLAEQIMNT